MLNLNPARAQKLNKFIVEDHFKTIRGLLEANNLFGKPEPLFNMNEKGCRLNFRLQAQTQRIKENTAVNPLKTNYVLIQH